LYYECKNHFYYKGKKFMGFKAFNLHPTLMKAIDDIGFKEPSPIQSKTFQPIVDGKDVIAIAQTGTGKTAAFAWPLLQRYIHNPQGKMRAMIIAPTRELAEQIAAEINKLGKHSKSSAFAIYGGVSKLKQITRLKKRCDILVACPGRLLDLANDFKFDFKQVETLILDEADMMLDMGFMPDIRRISKLVAHRNQTLMFSATMPKEIRKFANEVLHKPTEISIGSSKPVESVSHALYPIRQTLKGQLLKAFLDDLPFESTIVFTRTKMRAERVAKQLIKADYAATSLQGNMSQNKRQRSLDGFRQGKFQILVATDIAARGIDVSSISHVINFDIPDTVEAYVHRIGRTGRAAKSGDAITFVTDENRQMVRDIEKKLGKSIQRCTVDGFDYRQEPIKLGGPTRMPKKKKSSSKSGSKPDNASRGKSNSKFKDKAGNGEKTNSNSNYKAKDKFKENKVTTDLSSKTKVKAKFKFKSKSRTGALGTDTSVENRPKKKRSFGKSTKKKIGDRNVRNSDTGS
jgi:ATP-dependent RNA helicase RhlE